MNKTTMANNQNVVEDALFQIRNLEETLQENAKGILQSTMSEEIRQLVKESLQESKKKKGVKEQGTSPAAPSAKTQTNVDDEDMEMDDEDMEMDDEDMEMDDEDMEMDDEDMEMDDEDMEMDDEDMEMDDEDMEMDDEDMEMDDEDMEMDDEGETIDMRGASDAEVLKVFKAMGDDDGIVIKKEGEMLHLEDGDNEYMIRLRESERKMNEVIYEIEMDGDTSSKFGKNIYDESDYKLGEDIDSEPEHEYNEGWSWAGAAKGAMMGGIGLEEEDGYGSEEKVYEFEGDDLENAIAEAVEKTKKSIKNKGVGIGRGPKFAYGKKPNMSGGFNEKRKEAFGKGTKAMGTGKAKFEYKDETNGDFKNVRKMETKEAVRTNSYTRANKVGNRKGSDQNVNRKEIRVRPHTRINEEVEMLKEKNNEYKKALDVFRTKINEVAVFNSNLAYATRLFTEHSTTKQEKINILRRFDNVESLKESKNLYRTIKNELSSSVSSGSEQKLTESIERTVNKSVETGSAVNLIESKTYENPQFLRMKDLMLKIK